MGCDFYEYEDVSIHFSENDDDTACLCTFPHNYKETLDIGTLRSLAMLGAAIVLEHQGGYFEGDYVGLPGALPKWFIKELDRLLPSSK